MACCISRTGMTYSLTRQQVYLILLLLITLTSLYYVLPTRRKVEAPRDRSPPTRETPVFEQRLVAVGDLHGDFDNAKRVLQMVGTISSTDNPTWTAGSTILVQTGDIVDRGTYAWEIYRLMQALRSEAAGQGGRVVSILGNHEVMNAIGDWRYVTHDEIRHNGGTEQRMKDMAHDGWLGREWLANYSSTALVPLSPYPSAPLLSFTHGSLRPSYPNLLPYPDKINALGHSLLFKALSAQVPPHPPNPYQGIPHDATADEAELYAGGGPFWWRGLAEMGNEATVCKWADDLKKKMGVRRIIGGHTPNFEQIVDRCDASIIIIDTGISRAYGGVLSALEIVYTLHLPPTPSQPDHRQDPFVAQASVMAEPIPGRRYIEREEVHAIYPTGRKLITIEEKEITL